MPFTSSNPKLKKGRPKGSTTTGYSTLSEQEKQKYHKKAYKHSRKQEYDPQEENLSQEPSTSKELSTPGTPPSDKSSSSKKRGRRPINEHPMTPNTKKKRKNESQQKIRKKEKLSKKMSKIRKNFWQSRKESVEASDDSASDLDDIVPLEPEESIDQSSDVVFSKPTMYRYRARLQSCLPSNAMDNLNMFVCFIQGIDLPLNLKSEIVKLDAPKGSLNSRQLRYQVKKLHNKIKINQTYLCPIVKYWLGQLFQHRYIEVLFSDADINIDADILPKSFEVSREASKIAKDLVISRKNVVNSTKKTGIEFVVKVAKKCSLTINQHSDIALLSKATSCDRVFGHPK